MKDTQNIPYKRTLYGIDSSKINNVLISYVLKSCKFMRDIMYGQWFNFYQMHYPFQEPGTNAEIKEFATGKYGVKFDMFSKINVNGDNADPLYKYLKSKQGGTLGK